MPDFRIRAAARRKPATSSRVCCRQVPDAARRSILARRTASVQSSRQTATPSSLSAQPVHHVAAGQPRLAAGKAWRCAGHQVIEQAGMRGMIYAGSSGCRVVVVFHKPA